MDEARLKATCVELVDRLNGLDPASRRDHLEHIVLELYQFLANTFPHALKEEVISSLLDLIHALNDVERGVSPTLFRPELRGPGKKSESSDVYAKDIISGAAAFFIERGDNKQTAYREVAKRLNQTCAAMDKKDRFTPKQIREIYRYQFEGLRRSVNTPTPNATSYRYRSTEEVDNALRLAATFL